MNISSNIFNKTSPFVQKLIVELFFIFRYVNFEAEKTTDTRYRFDQPACNGCGNCISGCNTGAKNTLNMNYLPDAKVHGANIFTEVSYQH